MDILIKNIELPIVGRLVLAICPDGVVYKYTGDRNKYGIDSMQEYLTKSPAVPVPKHGRLIDADTVADYFFNYLTVCSPLMNMEKTREMVNTVKEACMIAPTILEATDGHTD